MKTTNFILIEIFLFYRKRGYIASVRLLCRNTVFQKKVRVYKIMLTFVIFYKMLRFLMIWWTRFALATIIYTIRRKSPTAAVLWFGFLWKEITLEKYKCTRK